MDELAKRFADLAEKYGPNVADAALSAARVEAYSTLAGGLMAALIGAAALYAALLLWRKAAASESYDNELIYGGAVLVAVIALIPLCIGVWQIVDPWTWITINHPELWIAKKAFHI